MLNLLLIPSQIALFEINETNHLAQKKDRTSGNPLAE